MTVGLYLSARVGFRILTVEVSLNTLQAPSGCLA